MFQHEDVDLRVLKNIFSDLRSANDFFNYYGPDFLADDVRFFADLIVDHVKVYKTTPTPRVLIDKVSDDVKLYADTKEVLELIKDIEVKPNELSYDIEKIKNRYLQEQEEQIRRDVSAGKNLSLLRRKIDEVERIRNGKRREFTQKSLKDHVKDFKKQYNEKLENPELGRGILTGYSCIDYVSNGFGLQELVIIGGDTGAGKMLPLDTQIPTPFGFKPMRDIHVGDEIFGRDGKVYQVLNESPVRTEPGWKFKFSDGSEIISHDDHLWLTFNIKEQLAISRLNDRAREKKNRKRCPVVRYPNLVKKMPKKDPPTGSVRNTQQIVDTLYTKWGKRNHAIPLVSALELPEKNLLIDPYVLGIWLGDGHSHCGAVTSMDNQIISQIQKFYNLHRVASKISIIDDELKENLASTFFFDQLSEDLKQFNLLKNKHVPDDYLWSSKSQRLALLQGLMDSDGWCGKFDGKVELCNTNKKLSEAVLFLFRSLGQRASITKGVAKLNGKIIGPKWTVRSTPDIPVFRLQRKLERQDCKFNINRKSRYKWKYIVSAERTPAVPMKCINVSSPDHLYLAGESLTVTHNSQFLNNIAKQIWLQKNFGKEDNFGTGYNVLYFSLEMPFEPCFRRTLSCFADVPSRSVRDAKLKKGEFASVNRVLDFIEKYPYQFEIIDTPRGTSIETMEARYLDARERFEPHVVVVDYLGLLEDSKMDDSDWLKLGQIAGKLHEFARYYNVLVLTAVQLNRVQPKGQKDISDTVGLHRIGRSSLIMHHANVGIQIETRKDEKNYSDFIYHIIKMRDGESNVKHNLIKNFANASLREPEIPYQPDNAINSGFEEWSSSEDMSEMLKKYGWKN